MNKKVLYGVFFALLVILTTNVFGFTVTPTSKTYTEAVGETIKEHLSIKNTETSTMAFTFSDKTLTLVGGDETLTIDINDTTIGAGTTKNVPFVIEIPDDATIGKYTGTLEISSGSETKQVSFTVNVKGVLAITEVEVTIGDEDETVDNGDTVSQEATPGDKMKIKVTAENFGDQDIEDITVKYTIEEIDGGDDMDDEADLTDLEPGEDDDVTFDITLPFIVDETTYKVVIEVEGKDENRNKQKDKFIFYFDIEKRKHDVVIERAVLTTSEVECIRTTTLDVTITNIGSEDEDEAFVKVTSSALGLNFEKVFSLDAGDDEDEVSQRISIPITVKDTQNPGTYRIDIISGYDRTRSMDANYVNLVVKKCTVQTNTNVDETQQKDTKEKEDKEVQEDEEKEENVVVTPQPNNFNQPQTGTIYEPRPSSTEKSWTSSPGYVTLLVLLNVLVIIIIVVLIVKFAGRR